MLNASSTHMAHKREFDYLRHFIPRAARNVLPTVLLSLDLFPPLGGMFVQV